MTPGQPQVADLLLHHATIHTVDAADSVAEADSVKSVRVPIVKLASVSYTVTPPPVATPPFTVRAPPVGAVASATTEKVPAADEVPAPLAEVTFCEPGDDEDVDDSV